MQLLWAEGEFRRKKHGRKDFDGPGQNHLLGEGPVGTSGVGNRDEMSKKLSKKLIGRRKKRLEKKKSV